MGLSVAEKQNLNNQLDILAAQCVLGKEGKGKPYIKGPRKGKKRDLYLLDEKILKKILNFLKPYVYVCVLKSQYKFDEDLAAILESEIWRLLREEGSKNFSKLVKLRIMNWCTSYNNLNQASSIRNVNIKAISYYTNYVNSRNESFELVEVLEEDTFKTSKDVTYLLNKEQKKLYNEFIFADKKDTKHIQRKYYSELKDIYTKIYS